MDRSAAAQTASATPPSVAPGARRSSKRTAINARANLTLLALMTLALVLQLVVWPFLLRAWGAPALLLMVPLVISTPMHWGLIHEAIHGQLFAERRWNETVARALAIAFALPFDAVRFGHLMHHRFTREPFDRPDVLDATTPHWQTRVSYYARILGGLYVGELALPALAFLPRKLARSQVMRAIGAEGPVGADVQRLFGGFAADPARRARIRRDALLALALFAVAFHFYGRWWPVLAETMYLRGVWLSLADNLPHHGVGLDVPGRARNFRVPRGWQGVLMNHHLHQWHHQHPTVPWTALPALAREAHDNAGATPAPAYFGSVLRQFKGPGALDATTS
ncbi:fatty acid desaturase [Paraburkholderia sp. DHOC27]|uniref:fatty acid desaturase n=1 Tax=Paraburkholderia sp. DHOC27 TaxID=2303330 RepID=UPI000E3C7AF8|nr:fatty acid desaturase [Paraburkholderia sp. DHOC27]RFU47268.1 fatty acid desaturase [Paraburkholderia sp. DHOC27]